MDGVSGQGTTSFGEGASHPDRPRGNTEAPHHPACSERCRQWLMGFHSSGSL